MVLYSFWIVLLHDLSGMPFLLASWGFQSRDWCGANPPPFPLLDGDKGCALAVPQCHRWLSFCLWATRKTYFLHDKGPFTQEPRWVSSWDEFRPEMTIFLFYNQYFHPGIPQGKLSHPSWIHLAHAFTNSSPMEHSSQEDRLHGIFRHISSQCLGQGWESFQLEVIPGQNHVNGSKKMTIYRAEFILGQKSSWGENSHVNGP